MEKFETEGDDRQLLHELYFCTKEGDKKIGF